MARQGSLCQTTLGRRWGYRTTRLLCALSALCLSVQVPDAIAQSPVQNGPSENRPSENGRVVDLNLRMRWTAERPQFWQIRIATAAGRDEAIGELTASATISQIVNRCDSLAAPGSFQVAKDGSAVTFTPRESLRDGEFDFRWRGSRETRISVQIHEGGKYARPPASPSDPAWNQLPAKLIDVDDLMGGQSLGGSVDSDQAAATSTWSMNRTSDDPLRIEAISNAGFAEISGTFSCSVRASGLADWASADLVLVYELRQASTGRVVSEKRWPLTLDADGNSVVVDIDEPSPAVMGVYEIHCRLEKDDDNLLMRLRRRPSLIAAVSAPILVTVPAAADADTVASQAWHEVAKIQPAASAEWELDQWLPNSSKRLIRRIDPREYSDLGRSEHAGQAVSVLQPGQDFTASLPSRQASLPHKITIRYPAGKQARLRVEIDTSEEFKQPSRAFLIAEEQHPSGKHGWRSQTFVHYPNATQEYIRLSNQSVTANAEFASITVEAGGPELSNDVDQQKVVSRLAALHVSGHQWVQQLTTDIAASAAQQKLDPHTQALHRFVVAADRLIDYAAAAGFNTVVVDACHGDRAWFDTEHCLANRKGCRFAGRCCESLLRIADTHSIRVVVGVELSMQLGDVESSLLANADPAGILRRTSEQSIRYNPQHAVVGKQISGLLSEIDQQLQGHESYAGLLLHCGENTHLSPYSEHQMDAAMLRVFAQSVGKAAMTDSQ